jgi:hypothetical protein
MSGRKAESSWLKKDISQLAATGMVPNAHNLARLEHFGASCCWRVNLELVVSLFGLWLD